MPIPTGDATTTQREHYGRFDVFLSPHIVTVSGRASIPSEVWAAHLGGGRPGIRLASGRRV
jgi:hypothetical protein